jgi:hypothetical protein
VITSNQPYRKLGSRNVVVVQALQLTAYWQWQWGNLKNLKNCRAAGPSILTHGVLVSFLRKTAVEFVLIQQTVLQSVNFATFLFIPVSGWEHSNTEPLNQKTNDRQIT